MVFWVKKIIVFLLIVSTITTCLTSCKSKNIVDKESIFSVVDFEKGFINDKNFDLEYPRPQFKRDNWFNLNGEWNFLFDDDNVGEKEKYFINFPCEKVINVPFTYETKLSGIGDESVHSAVWYNREFSLSSDDLNKELLLHFEGSDYYTKVWINGTFVGENKGGYHRFSFEISKYAKSGENDITVKVEDSLSTEQPRGKQRYRSESFSCWYVQTTGIWKTVWLEKASDKRLNHVKIITNYDAKSVKFEYDVNLSNSTLERYYCVVEAIISYEDKVITKSKINLNTEDNHLTVFLKNDGEFFEWSPETPNLYDVKFNLYCNDELCDSVGSYFGLRKISISGDKILLNNNPINLKMVLDQGYWKDSHLTPPSGQALLDDINTTFKYGYNGARKHQKIEDERYLYLCDKMGLLVWSEMANTFSFSTKSMSNFIDEWKKIVNQNYNHPSIITWVPFNESWGFSNLGKNVTQQNFANSIYLMTKALDPTRPVVTNDGWQQTMTDIITIHEYRHDAEELYNAYTDEGLEILNGKLAYSCNNKLLADGYEYNGQPVLMSEYGGISYYKETNEKGDWSYGGVKSEEEFINKFKELTETIGKIPYISGYCYTQITDVQQEMNGLLYENREPKFSEEGIKKIKEINDKMYSN